MSNYRLTIKQARFINEYLIDGNATRAALAAGYSAQTASVIGWENLRKPQIHTAIQEAQRQLAAKNDLSAERLLREYTRIAFARIDDFISWGPEGLLLKDAAELPPNATVAIQRLRHGDRGRRKVQGITLHGKLAALHQIGVYLGLWEANRRS